MNTTALLEAVRKDSRTGLLLVAERLGAALAGDASLQELAKGLTGHVPQDERSRGVRDALLELLSAAEAARLNAVRRRLPAVVAKGSWKDVLEQLADGNVHQLTKIAAALGGEKKKGSVSSVLDELEEEGLVEPAVGPGMAKNARYVRLTEGGLTFVATLAPTRALPAVKRAAPAAAQGSVRWFDDSKGFGFVVDADACRVAQNRSTLVFDLSDHPDQSWDELGVDLSMLGRVLGEATRDPRRRVRLSKALDLVQPEIELAEKSTRTEKPPIDLEEFTLESPRDSKRQTRGQISGKVVLQHKPDKK